VYSYLSALEVLNVTNLRGFTLYLLPNVFCLKITILNYFRVKFCMNGMVYVAFKDVR
jgi:hypothetical protein